MRIVWELEKIKQTDGGNACRYLYSGQYRTKRVFADVQVVLREGSIPKVESKYSMENHDKIYEYEHQLINLIDWKLTDRTYFVRIWRYREPTDYIFPHKDEALSFYRYACENGECSREHVRDNKGNILEGDMAGITWPDVWAKKERF